MKTIGLTGGIGTGKTEVSRVLRDLGAEVVNADAVAHETYEPGTQGWREIVREFGRDVLTADGRIDRKKLGAIVFEDGSRLGRLNAIVHPLTRDLLRERVRRLMEDGRKPVVVEVPLLIEAMGRDEQWASLVDEVWVVTAPEHLVVERLLERGGMDVEAIMARVRVQLSQSERVPHADVVIENGGGLNDLRERVLAAWSESEAE